MKGLRYISALMAALFLGSLPVQAQKDVTFDFSSYSIEPGQASIDLNNGWSNGNDRLVLTLSSAGNTWDTAGHIYLSPTSDATYLEVEGGSSLTLSISQSTAGYENYAFSHLVINLANGSSMNLIPNQGELVTDSEIIYDWNIESEPYVQNLVFTATEATQISSILVQLLYTAPLDLSSIPVEDGFYFGAPDVHPLYYFSQGYSICDSVFTNSLGVTLSFSGENSPVLSVKNPGSDDDYPALAGINGEYSMIFTPPTGKAITQISFDGDFSEGATVSSGTLTGGLYGDTDSDDACTWNGNTTAPLTIHVTNLTHSYIEMVQVTLGDASTPPTSDEMTAYINAALNTTVSTTEASLDFNGQGNAELAQVLMNYYPEGYPLDEVPLNFGSVNMTFSGGSAMLRVAPTGGLEIGATGPYLLRLSSTSTMTDITFVPDGMSEYSMQSAGCVPSIFAGTGNEGSFTDNQWNGSATDLQITMTENSPAFTSVHVSYGATLIPAMTPEFEYDEVSHTLTITTTTDGATIYYTLDGSEPTTSSYIYTDPIVLTGNTYVQAIAGGDGYESSGIKEFQNNDFKVSPVQFFYSNDSHMLMLWSDTEDAKIYFTRNGSFVTDTLTAEIYNDQIIIESASQFPYDIEAFARRNGYNDSDVTFFEREGHITAAPQFERNGNEVTITCETPGATIYYSQDSSAEPTTIYETPVTFWENAPSGYMQAQAAAPEMVPSDVVTYAVDWFKCGNVIFTFENNQLTMECEDMTDGVQIYYTTDGTQPTTESTLYTGPISLTTGDVVNAFATRPGWNDSDVTTFNLDEYQTPIPGIVREDQIVTIFNESGMPISVAYFLSPQELDLHNYNEIQNSYQMALATHEQQVIAGNNNLPEVIGGVMQVDEGEAQIFVSHNGYLYVAALADDLASSEVYFEQVTGIQAEPPTFTFTNLHLEMSTESLGADIYYTTDGTTPTLESPQYTEPIAFESDAQVQAIAANELYYDNSTVSTYNFVMAEHTTATPQFSRESNDLYIHSETPGARIYYIIDNGGSVTGPNEAMPDSTSTLYAGPIHLEGNVTVKAIAYAAGYYPSAVNTYQASEFQCEAPEFVFENLSLMINCATDGATIYYTTDGTIPTTASNTYNEPIALTTDCTVRAIAVRQGWTASEVSQFVFVAADYTVATPVVSRSGSYITLSTTTEGAQIFYNTSGEQATENDILYTEPFIPSANGILHIVAIAPGLLPGYADYEVNWLTTSNVQFTYAYPYLTMTTASPDATIYYTLDGSEPDTLNNANTYTYNIYEPIEILENTIVRAMAVRPGYNPSAVTQYQVDIDANTAAAPDIVREGNSVIITTATQGATIYYTTDGSEPTLNSPTYNEPIVPVQNGILRAIAVANGFANSAISEFAVDWFNCENVTFAFDSRTVVLTSATDGAEIRYTLDGSEPDANSTLYEGPLALTVNTTVNAIAYRQGYNPSEITTYAFVVADHTCATPQFNREGNTLTISSTTEGATIYYTTDGSTPDLNSFWGEGDVTIPLDGNMTIKAIAVREDLFNSAVGTYTSNDFQVAGVTFTYEGLRLHMSTTTEGATIYYTTNGSVPTVDSEIYEQPIELTADCVVRAIAVREGWTASAATTYNFSLAAVTVATPQFSRQGNEVIITSTTADATIYYTLDGSDPLTGNYFEYTNPIHLDGNATIRAIATRDDLYPSAISTYNASEFQVAAVTFSYSNLYLTLQTATEGATIYYTTDGSEPTANSTVYQNPIQLTADCVVRAIAIRQNWVDSDMSEYVFTLAAVTVATPQFSRNGNLLYITTTTQGATIYYSTDGSDPNTEYTGAIQLDGNGYVLARAVADGYYPSQISEFQVNWFQVADVEFTFSNLQLIMSTSTPGATIHYTTDGTVPSSLSPVYDAPLTLTEDCVVQAFAVREGWQNSQLTAYEFNLDNVTADSPLISREGALVTITNVTQGTTIYYTTDGSTPTTASNQYTGPIQVTQNCVIRAMATGQNFNPSPVVSYTVDWFQAERVEFAYNELYLQMYTSTAEATIYYTTDGSYPSEESYVFTDPIMLTEDCDVRAIAVRQGWTTSDVTLYHFRRAAVTAPTPQFYRNGNLLSITTGNQNVQVFYTLDGSEPDYTSNEYTGPLTLTENVTVRAIALNEHFYFPSAVNTYVVDWFQVSSVEFALNEMRLTLSTPTPDAAIYYTLDGTVPDANSVPYVAPLTLTTDVDVRAVAVRQGWINAPVSLYHFNLSSHTAPTPQFRRNGNQLSISTGVTDVEIRYTLDGSVPGANSEVYSAPIQLTQNGVVRAIAIGHNYANSAVALYQVDWFRAASVEFMLFGQELELNTSTDEAEIHYTLDGSQPTVNSPIYTAPLMLTADTDVRAIVIKEGWTNSEVSLFQFRRATVTAATPNFSRSGNELILTSATPDATIYYTLDGTTPTTASAIYEGSIHVNQNCLVSAIAISEGNLQSGVSTYMVNWFTVEDVTFTYAGGRLAMQTATEGARIYYTLDGSQPTEQSTRYTSPIAIEESCVVHAIAIREEMQPSNISSYYFSLENPGAVTPIFEFADGLLHIFCPTRDSRIYYTMDGSMPTESSQLYQTPIQLTRNCTVRAIATAPGYRTSGVAEFTTDIFRVDEIHAELFEGFLYLISETPNAIIHYTLDGSTPTAASPVFDTPIPLTERTIVKAYGERDGYTSSNLLVTEVDPNETYCGIPQIDLADRMLTISTITDGAKIYYTLDESNPAEEGILYEGAITLEHNCVVHAVAMKEGYNNSEVARRVIDNFYTDLPKFTSATAGLEISCSTPGATLYYTTDGSDPRESTTRTAYTAPITDLTNTSVVKAMAERDFFNPSAVVDFDIAVSAQDTVRIDCDGQAFTLTATDGAAIYYTTDGTNPTTASARYLTVTPLDGLCTIRAIAVKEGCNNSNESIYEVPAFFDGKTVTLRYAGVLSQALGNNKGKITELAVVGHINDADLTAIRQETKALETLDLKLASTADHVLPAGAFNNASFVTVSLPSDVQSTGRGLFAGCHNLAAVIWNAQTRISNEAFEEIQNPNLLLYVGAAGYAPANISNIIVGRQAQRITLTDGETDGNFHSPRQFYAKQITYTHNYTMQTGINNVRGWETLAVPFNVTRISHAQRGEIVPFGKELSEDQQLPRFWLRELQADGFVPTTTIQAHVPYVISMPNHPEYADRYILAGSVTFEGQNVIVDITEPVTETDGNGRKLTSNFRHQNKSDDLLVLNREATTDGDLEGSIFLASNRDVLPFEAFVQATGTSSVKLFEEIETGIENVPAYMLRSNSRAADGIFDLSGRRIEKAAQKGIYIVNGKKVLK